ncbi:FAD-dependent oxidoreductase [Roseomonas sp. OT10]|uniref:FAD-dependent oxidoreductase n=1 Tax=Roseomonas cutis TaxID=2897332 RepID=UPI001E29047B|nr:FAD-dependent oxidoreductase [Roseomonas sp. OT10]UFN50524.1 FAD-dependent oxidoreductase [Roseomonas sp. OT10]
MPDTDLAVIGAGAAGLSVATLAAALGLRVTLFERDRAGGRRLAEEVPAQALLACARAAQAVRDSGRFGVRAGDLAIDWTRVRDRMAEAALAYGRDASLARVRGLGVEVVPAAARFDGPGTVAAADRIWRFRRCLLAAGSVPAMPELPGIAEAPALAPAELLDLADPPGHLMVLGGGAEGLALAQAYRRLGSLVTVIEPGPLAPGEDPELAAVLRAALAQDGVTLLEDAALARAEKRPDGLTLLLADGRRVAGTHLLVAQGRRPHLTPLDLAAGRVEAGEAGVAVDAGLRSRSNRRVWAAGSLAAPGEGGRGTAETQVGLLLRSLLFRLPVRGGAAPAPRLIRTDPALVQAGLTEAEAEARGLQPRTQRFPLAHAARGMAEGCSAGLVKLVSDRRGRLLGAGVAGPGAEGMAGLFSALLAGRRSLSDLATLPLPALAEAEAARQAATGFYAPLATGPWARKLARVARLLP